MDSTINEGIAPFFGGVTKTEKRQRLVIAGLLVSNVVTALILSIAVFFVAMKPDRILVTDTHGRLLGEFMTSAVRTEDEIIAGTVRFIECQYSLNAATILEDAACAMNMMDKGLYDERLKFFRETNFVNRTIESKTRSRIDKDSVNIEIEGTRTIEDPTTGNEKTLTTVAVSGNMIVDDSAYSPFNVTLVWRHEPITPLNTSGMKLEESNEYSL